MSLSDVSLPKQYKNGRVLYEQTLDVWRLATEAGFSTVNLNLTQLARDCFVSGYTFDNDGVANLTTSLQDQINDLATGSTPITGTTSDTFSINTDGSTAVLTTTALTALRTFTFPDITGSFVVTEGTQTINGVKTFSGAATITGLATLTAGFAATATSTIILSQNAITSLTIQNSNAGVAAEATLAVINGTAIGYLSTAGTSFTTAGAYTANSTRLYNDNAAGLVLMAANGSGVIKFAAGGTAEVARIAANGNFGIGTTGPDSKLDVLSTSDQLRLTYTDGSVYSILTTTSAGYLSISATAARVGIGISSPGTSLHVNATASACSIRITADATYSAALQIGSTNGYAFVYNSSTDLLNLNRDVPLGTGSGTSWSINSACELLLPAVDPPTANYGNRNGFVKAWIYCATGGTTNNDSYNVSSIADNGTGREEIFWNTNFATTNYALATHSEDSGSDILVFSFSRATTSVELRTYDVSGAALVDSSIGVIAIGDQ